MGVSSIMCASPCRGQTRHHQQLSWRKFQFLKTETNFNVFLTNTERVNDVNIAKQKLFSYYISYSTLKQFFTIGFDNANIMVKYMLSKCFGSKAYH